MNAPTQMICYPPAAANGGPLESALPKVGEWVWQPKVDDWRAVIHAPSGTVWNQYGKLSSITDKFAASLGFLFQKWTIEADKPACGGWNIEWLDVGMMENRNDMMRGSVIVFDWITPRLPFIERRSALQETFEIMPLATTLMAGGKDMRDNQVYLIPSAWGETEGRTLDAILRLENRALGDRKFYEGVVCKRADSLYPFGRKAKQVTPDWIKHRHDQG